MHKRRQKAWHLRPCCLLLAACLGLPACGRSDASEGTPRQPISVRVEALVPRESRERVMLPGVVEAHERAELSFRVTGYVAEVDVEEGDRVEEGQPLASLEREDLERQLREAQGALAIAKARMASARRELDRQQRLQASGSSSRARLDAARTEWDVAVAEHEVASARLDEARDRLDKSELRAPFAGFVSDRQVEPHQLVRAQDPAVVLLDLASVRVRASLADSMAARLRKGNPVRVSSDLWPGRVFSGEVSRMAKSADPATHAVPFEAEIANPDFALLPHLVVDLDLEIGQPSRALLVPLRAVLRDADRRPFCFVVDQPPSGAPFASRRFVELGQLRGDRLQIQSGLAEGDRVITRGQHYVRDGDPVHIVDD